MSSAATPVKRSKEGAPKRRSKSVSSSSSRKDKTGGRRKIKDASGKRRRSVSKSDGGKSGSRSIKRRKVEDAADGVKREPAPKPESARKIKVPWDEPKREDYCMRGNPFKRVVLECSHEITHQKKLPEMRYASKVTRSIQKAVEEEAIELMRQAAVLAMHAHRTTVQEDDITQALRLRRPIELEHAKKMYDEIVEKRAEAASAAPAVDGLVSGDAPSTVKKEKKLKKNKSKDQAATATPVPMVIAP